MTRTAIIFKGKHCSFTNLANESLVNKHIMMVIWSISRASDTLISIPYYQTDSKAFSQTVLIRTVQKCSENEKDSIA